MSEIIFSGVVLPECLVLNINGDLDRHTVYVCVYVLFTERCSVCFRTPDSDFWSKLFERILNADGKSTVPLLRELREEINEMFDSSFKERLLLTLAAVGETFLLVNFQ